MEPRVKRKIITLREGGASFGQIAAITGVGRETIKSWCRRNNITPHPRRTPMDGVCEHCGKAIDQPRRGQRFCSRACRMSWWHAHPMMLERRAITSHTCAGCGATFEAYGNKHRKYCTHACYIRARFGTRGGRP